MPTPGKSVATTTGKRGLRSTGKAAVYDANGACGECCCTIEVLGSFTTNGSTNPVWDLTPFQGPGMASPGAFWRLIEMGNCFPRSHPWYGAGCVGSDGTLVGLANSFRSRFNYDGFLQLQIGCPESSQIHWPGACQTFTPVYAC